MLLGNASLTRVYAGNVDDYGEPVAGGGAVKWHGETPAKVVDRYVQSTSGGDLNQFQQVVVWFPSRLVADDGGYLALEVGDALEVQQDGATTIYVVAAFSDMGNRMLATRSLIKAVVDRRAA